MLSHSFQINFYADVNTLFCSSKDYKAVEKEISSNCVRWYVCFNTFLEVHHTEGIKIWRACPPTRSLRYPNHRKRKKNTDWETFLLHLSQNQKTPGLHNIHIFHIYNKISQLKLCWHMSVVWRWWRSAFLKLNFVHAQRINFFFRLQCSSSDSHMPSKSCLILQKMFSTTQ